MNSFPATTASATKPVADLSPGYGAQHHVVSDRGETITPAVLERLEMLDDALFAALAGDDEAIDRFFAMWRNAVDTTPDELLEDSREHYVRHAELRTDSSSARRLLGLLADSADAA